MFDLTKIVAIDNIRPYTTEDILKMIFCVCGRVLSKKYTSPIVHTKLVYYKCKCRNRLTIEHKGENICSIKTLDEVGMTHNELPSPSFISYYENGNIRNVAYHRHGRLHNPFGSARICYVHRGSYSVAGNTPIYTIKGRFAMYHEYWVNGLRHNPVGPAHSDFTGHAFYFNGGYVSESCFLERLEKTLNVQS